MESELHSKQPQRLRPFNGTVKTALSESTDMTPSQKHTWDSSGHQDEKSCLWVSLWKGREHQRAGLSCSFASLCSDLNISQICPQDRSWQGRCLTRLCRLLCRQPGLNQSSQACSPSPAALMRQVSRATADRNMHHRLEHSYPRTGNRTQAGTALLDLIPQPSQGLSAALVCCPEPSSGPLVTDQSPIHWCTWQYSESYILPPEQIQWADSLWNGTVLKTARCCACQRTRELTLLVVTGSRRCSSSAPFIPLTCTVLPSPGGRSRSQTVFCWSQELACSVKHKVFCSIVLRSPARVYYPETILSASLDVSALAVMENPQMLSQESYWGVYLSTVNNTIVQRIALLLPAKPSTSVPGHILEQFALHTHPSQTSSPKIALFYSPQAGQHRNTCMLPAGRDLSLVSVEALVK